MYSLVVSAASVFLAAGLYVAGMMMLGTQISLGLADAGHAATTVSLVMIQYSFGFMAGSWLGPRLISRVGHIRVFSAFSSLVCCLALLHGAFLDPWLWGLLRGLTGFCGALLLIVLESWINAHATAATRGRLMGFYMINYYLAGAAGQWLVGLPDAGDFRAWSLCAGLLVLSSVPLALTSRPAPPLPPAGRLAIRPLLAASRISVVGACAAGFALASFYQLAPVHLHQLGADTGTISRYMALAVLASMLLQLPVGRLADRYDRRRVILGLALAIAVSALGVAIFGGLSQTLLFAASMLFLGVTSCLYPTCLARLHDRTQGQGQSHVGANATLLLCYGVGQCLGPLSTALLMTLSGPAGLYLGIALVLLIYALYAGHRLRVADTAVAEQKKFVAVSPSTPVLAQLDPRAEPAPPPTAPGQDRLSTP
ncbi:MAG TPA: MFS transporter [Nevskiaceae bacterium]|nr:MFS transporter [Nevskiaceae bacterium]